MVRRFMLSCFVQMVYHKNITLPTQKFPFKIAHLEEPPITKLRDNRISVRGTRMNTINNELWSAGVGEVVRSNQMLNQLIVLIQIRYIRNSNINENDPSSFIFYNIPEYDINKKEKELVEDR